MLLVIQQLDHLLPLEVRTNFLDLITGPKIAYLINITFSVWS